MFIEDFSPTQRLATEVCPRCRSVGLLEIDRDIYRAALDQDRHESRYLVCPSVYCRCPACGLVAELSGLRMDVIEET